MCAVKARERYARANRKMVGKPLPEAVRLRKRAAHRRWVARNPEKAGAHGTSQWHWTHIAERDNWTCWLCGDTAWVTTWVAERPDPHYPSVDHVVPISLGGPDTLENVRLAHYRCNVRRGPGRLG